VSYFNDDFVAFREDTHGLKASFMVKVGSINREAMVTLQFKEICRLCWNGWAGAAMVLDWQRHKI
jgi:hypothetical protein